MFCERLEGDVFGLNTLLTSGCDDVAEFGLANWVSNEKVLAAIELDIFVGNDVTVEGFWRKFFEMEIKKVQNSRLF